MLYTVGIDFIVIGAWAWVCYHVGYGAMYLVDVIVRLAQGGW